MIAPTPTPPYYAVIFSNEKKQISKEYEAMAKHMVELASQQPGFLGYESAGSTFSITISYWESLEAIKNWKAHTEHVHAQSLGRSMWYQAYKTRICLVERDYEFYAKPED